MSCFLECLGKSSKKKIKENPNHNSKQNPNSNYSNKPDDPTSSTSDESAAMQQLAFRRDVNVRQEEAGEVASSSGVRNSSVFMGISGTGISGSTKARTFTYFELVEATNNFRSGFLGEGGFGKVYKGKLIDTSEVVAIKQLDRNGVQGIREFVVEVLTLSKVDHPNLVKLIGYCAEGFQRLLVYEYMPLGSLESHLHDLRLNQMPLDWNTRMEIAAGAARGLEYLHDKMTPPIIYRDLKCSNILLGEGYHPKLSDFGLAKVGPVGDKTHVSTRVMGTYGYCAPDYAMTGQLTFRSDIYSFGVVLLELITGRKAIQMIGGREQNLVAWARPMFSDRRKFSLMADPALEGQYPTRGLYQALAIAAMCVQEQPNMRPLVGDVVTALNYIVSQNYDPNAQSCHHRRTPSSPGVKKDFGSNSKGPVSGDNQSSDSED
ncbi:unnamed protein product [Amaranthus hypochondriacus]